MLFNLIKPKFDHLKTLHELDNLKGIVSFTEIWDEEGNTTYAVLGMNPEHAKIVSESLLRNEKEFYEHLFIPERKVLVWSILGDFRHIIKKYGIPDRYILVDVHLLWRAMNNTDSYVENNKDITKLCNCYGNWHNENKPGDRKWIAIKALAIYQIYNQLRYQHRTQ